VGEAINTSPTPIHYGRKRGFVATLEKIIIKIYPMSEERRPYVVTCEHTAPNCLSVTLQEKIFKILNEEFIAQGVENIKAF
jgi:hypothetical protein